MSIETISRNDPRYSTLMRGRNARFPASEADAVGRIEVCDSAEDVVLALQRAVSDGLRPTVRSGGHCYEDFVYNNPGGVVIDMSTMGDTSQITLEELTHIAGGGSARIKR